MRFTDIFIRRPVLASVVSLLIWCSACAPWERCRCCNTRRRERRSDHHDGLLRCRPGRGGGFVTTPLENAVAQANGIDYMSSTSQSGVSTITVYLRLNYDADKALTEINTKIASVLNQFACRYAAADADGEGRADHRCDVYRLQFHGAGRQPITDYWCASCSEVAGVPACRPPNCWAASRSRCAPGWIRRSSRRRV